VIETAKPSHIPGIVELAQQWTREYPSLKPDAGRIHEAVRQCVSGAQHFAQVAVEEGRVMGATLALVNNHLWAQRKQAHIVFWVSNIPGEGATMLRNCLAWAEPRRGIRVVGMTPDFEMDPRALLLAERIGLRRNGGAYLWINGA